MTRTDHPASGRDALEGEERLHTQYEPPALVVIGPVTEFTFGSKKNGNDAPFGMTKNS
jgi:hypothetical protein